MRTVSAAGNRFPAAFYWRRRMFARPRFGEAAGRWTGTGSGATQRELSFVVHSESDVAHRSAASAWYTGGSRAAA